MSLLLQLIDPLTNIIIIDNINIIIIINFIIIIIINIIIIQINLLHFLNLL